MSGPKPLLEPNRTSRIYKIRPNGCREHYDPVRGTRFAILAIASSLPASASTGFRAAARRDAVDFAGSSAGFAAGSQRRQSGILVSSFRGCNLDQPAGIAKASRWRGLKSSLSR